MCIIIKKRVKKKKDKRERKSSQEERNVDDGKSRNSITLLVTLYYKRIDDFYADLLNLALLHPILQQTFDQ